MGQGKKQGRILMLRARKMLRLRKKNLLNLRILKMNLNMTNVLYFPIEDGQSTPIPDP